VLVDVLVRVHAAIIAADFGEPHVQFVLSDSPITGGTGKMKGIKGSGTQAHARTGRILGLRLHW
jgi:hypothetical protein